MSPAMPHKYEVNAVNPLLDVKTNQWPDEGRNTATSVLPAPS